MAGRERKPIAGARRMQAVFFAENLIAQMLEPWEVSTRLVKKYNCSRLAADAIQKEAMRRLMDEDDRNRRERFKTVLRALRRLYASAFARGRLTVCANVLSQMRVMFDLDRPFIEDAGAGASDATDDRPVEDLEFFAEHGYWPEEKKQRAMADVATNPLDDLV